MEPDHHSWELVFGLRVLQTDKQTFMIPSSPTENGTSVLLFAFICCVCVGGGGGGGGEESVCERYCHAVTSLANVYEYFMWPSITAVVF